MQDLSKIVNEAIGNQGIEVNIPFVNDVLNKLKTNTSSFIGDIFSNTDRERIIDQIYLEAKGGNINHALVIASKLHDSILNKLYKSYPFQLTDLRHEDNNEIVRLKRIINQLLTYKAHKLFNSGRKKEAHNLLNNQREYLNETRYKGYEVDIYDWEVVEHKWNSIIDEQDINERFTLQVKQQNKGYNHENSGQNHFIKGKVQKSNELDEIEKGIIENNTEISRYNAMLTLGKIEDAINLCLDRLIFFLGRENDLVYNPLLLANSVYIKEWKDLLGSIINSKNIINLIYPNEVKEKIYHIIDKPTINNIRTELTQLLFKLEASDFL